MANIRFNRIYEDVKEKIIRGDYPFQELLPSENTMTELYGCSRSAVRRAFLELIRDGYIQSVPKKGYRVIYSPFQKHIFSTGFMTTFKESLQGTGLTPQTTVIEFLQRTVNRELSAETGFPEGTEVWYIKRIRSANGVPIHWDRNIFRKDFVPDMTEEIASNSIYEYIENQLNKTIMSAKCEITMQPCDAEDRDYLKLVASCYVAVTKNKVFNSDGVQFEYSCSHHNPKYFCFQNTPSRRKN